MYLCTNVLYIFILCTNKINGVVSVLLAFRCMNSLRVFLVLLLFHDIVFLYKTSFFVVSLGSCFEVSSQDKMIFFFSNFQDFYFSSKIVNIGKFNFFAIIQTLRTLPRKPFRAHLQPVQRSVCNLCSGCGSHSNCLNNNNNTSAR